MDAGDAIATGIWLPASRPDIARSPPRSPSWDRAYPATSSSAPPDAARPAAAATTIPIYRHGPYPSWIRKIGERTVTRNLNPAQAERYRPMFDNTKRLKQLVAEIEAISADAVEEAEGWVRT